MISVPIEDSGSLEVLGWLRWKGDYEKGSWTLEAAHNKEAQFVMVADEVGRRFRSKERAAYRTPFGEVVAFENFDGTSSVVEEVAGSQGAELGDYPRPAEWPPEMDQIEGRDV